MKIWIIIHSPDYDFCETYTVLLGIFATLTIAPPKWFDLLSDICCVLIIGFIIIKYKDIQWSCTCNIK